MPELELAQQKIRTLRMQHSGFTKNLVTRIAKDDVLALIHKRMREANFSPKIIEGTTVSKVTIFPRHFRIFFKSEYFAESGFDVALAREHGTRDHELPKVEDRTYAWDIGGGKIAFSKGHKVKGLPALLIIFNTLAEQEQKMNEKYKAEFKKWIELNMAGIANA